MNINLRGYQMEGVTGIRANLARGDRVICFQGPTAMGKTVIFSYITYHAALKGHSTWILVHRRELLRQASDSIRNLGVEHGLISPGFTPNPLAMTQIASIDTLRNRYMKYPIPKIIIADEFHHCVSPTWFKVLQYYIEQGTRIIGFTATPNRLDGRGLGKSAGGLCDSMVLGPQPGELIAQGYLARPKIFAPSLATPENLHQKFGEYKKDEVSDMMDRPAIIGDAVKHYSRICPNLPTIVFVPSLKMGDHVQEQYRAAGYQATMIDGTMTEAERKGRLHALGNGGLHLLISCQLIDEGVDVPVVAGIQMLNPTKSLGRFLQQSGRGARMFSGKTGYFLLDHVCNTFYPNMEPHHGNPAWDREWSLDGEVKKKKTKKEETDLRVVQCEKCYSVYMPAPRCPYCGHVPEAAGRSIEQLDGTLLEVDDEATRERYRQAEAMRQREFAMKEERACRTLEDFLAIAEKRGYHKKWAYIRWDLKQKRSGRTAPNLPGI